MKKISALFLVIVSIFIFSSCSKGEAEQTTVQEETTLSPTVKITFPEGYSAVQIAQKLEENAVCPAADFMTEVNTTEGLEEVYTFISGINTKNRAYALEGYIFPDTYEFYRGESAKSALARFLSNTESKLTEEYYQKAKALGYSIDEIITMASIIQKEAGIKSEMPNVSCVLHNRLKSSDFPKIQCDVTINYLNDYVIDSPYLDGDTNRFSEFYNTYKCSGLPVGAICNPGIEAIDAALNPVNADYYYFVTDDSNNYYYAKTYEEHKENCRICGIEGY
ncbi:MAG: endolytic transglycosylase MltG [Acutalibacteraceae bacterium]